MFRGLLSVHSRYGLPARGVAQGDPFHRRLRQFCYLHCRSDCYRLERPLAGWELHPLKIYAFSRRTSGSFESILSLGWLRPPERAKTSPWDDEAAGATPGIKWNELKPFRGPCRRGRGYGDWIGEDKREDKGSAYFNLCPLAPSHLQ